MSTPVAPPARPRAPVARRLPAALVPILLIALTACAPAVAADLPPFPPEGAEDRPDVRYVTVDGSDEEGDGSPSRPWATIGHALSEIPDGGLVLVGPGEYRGVTRLAGVFEEGVTIRSGVPYQARLRAEDTVLQVRGGDEAAGIAVEGFDIAHAGRGADPVVVAIDGGGDGRARDLEIRNNVIHDSRNNDLLKINNQARRILVEGNVFYNQSGWDEHIDVNGADEVVIQDNVFFNDFRRSGRSDTAQFIVIKDSGGGKAENDGARDVIVRRNVMLNWQGSHFGSFIALGEDDAPHYQAVGTLVENNLLIGNSDRLIRAAFSLRGADGASFRHNTVTGDLPATSYGALLEAGENVPPNHDIEFVGNVFHDSSGTMASERGGGGLVYEVKAVDDGGVALRRNLYWNGGEDLREDDGARIEDEEGSVTADPGLPDVPRRIPLPRWDPQDGAFEDGSSTIEEAFVRLVRAYAPPAAGGPAVDAGEPGVVSEDILGRPRGERPDLGAYEVGAHEAGAHEAGAHETGAGAP